MQLNQIERKKRMQSNEISPPPLAEVQCRELDAVVSFRPSTIVIVEDGQSQAAALQSAGLPPDSRGILFITPQDALL
jgi:hypothetical protein